MDFVINSYDIAEMSISAFEKTKTDIVVNNDKKQKFKKLCEMIDFAYVCWECTQISTEVSDDNEIIISLSCMDATVQNKDFDENEDIDGLGEIDNTFYRIADMVKAIRFDPTDSGIVISFIIPGIWDK